MNPKSVVKKLFKEFSRGKTVKIQLANGEKVAVAELRHADRNFGGHIIAFHTQGRQTYIKIWNGQTSESIARPNCSPPIFLLEIAPRACGNYRENFNGQNRERLVVICPQLNLAVSHYYWQGELKQTVLKMMARFEKLYSPLQNKEVSYWLPAEQAALLPAALN